MFYFIFRYGPRSSAPPPGYPPMGVKQLPPVGNLPVQSEQPGYRGRYEGPPFEDIPPGGEPPVPGFEPSPFEKPPFGPAGPIDRDRLPPPNYRDPYRPPPYGDGPTGYRDMPIPPLVQNEIPVHVGEQPPRYRDNYRPGHYRDQGPMPFRDGQPYREPGPPGPPGPYRDPGFRGGPPPFRDNSYRNVPYRDGVFRDNPPHNSFREPGVPFRPPSADPREPVPLGYHDPNYRDNFRDESAALREHSRPGYRPNVRNRGGPRRNPNVEHDRHREREGRDRERYNDNREPIDKAERTRDPDRRSGYDKNRDTRESREDRPRDYERPPRDYEKERDHDKTSPEKKVRTSPKRSREAREKKRSESKGRSRDRDCRREKKEERAREKSSADRSRDHKDKEKEKKLKERKKKKREKEKDIEKKKKREKKDKKEKDHVKKEDEVHEKEEDKTDDKETDKTETDASVVVKIEKTNTDVVPIKKENFPKVEAPEKPADDLYGDELGAVDKEIIENYVKTEDKDLSTENKITESINNSKEELFDGIELQASAEELELKAEIEVSNPSNKEMLATLPELSKWEVDEDHADKVKEPGEITSPDEEEDGSKVTSDVIKRAENAIFAKAINSLRPIEIKKISSDRLKLYGDEVPKPMNNIQITVPVVDSESRSIEINERKRRYSKTPPPRLSVKDRLGGKVEETRRGREPRVVQSTVERVKSRSKTPKREQPYRRVTVEKDRGRKQDTVRAEPSKSDRRVMSEAVKTGEKHRARSPTEKKNSEKHKDEKKTSTNEVSTRDRGQEKNVPGEAKSTHADRERKKSTLDEAHFEPDYDETVESDHDNKEENVNKRERSASPNVFNETKKAKLDSDTIKLDLTNVKKKPDSESESTSDSEYSSSSSSSDARKRKKKKKRSKKKKKRAASESESESESSSDDHKKKKKKRKHKKKSSKKKKKSKHK